MTEPAGRDPRRIVVGIDGSVGSRAALRFAMDEAELRGCTVDVVHAWREPHVLVPEQYDETLVEQGRTEEAARRFIADEVEVLHPAASVHIEPHPRHGSAAGALVERSAGAALVVVGRVGEGGHPLFGTVADQVAHHSQCPVVVVPQHTSGPHGRIVVGVDGSPEAAAALRWAREEANRRRSRLVALMAWDLLEQRPGASAPAFDPHYDAGAARAVLDATVKDVLGADAASVDTIAVNDLPTRALAEAALDADLLVVGARGLGGFRALLLGSVSHRLLRTSPCATVVVR